jgi:hypothetical protein
MGVTVGGVVGLMAGAWEYSRLGKSNREKITANFCGRMVVEELWQRWIVDVKREDVKEVEEVTELAVVLWQRGILSAVGVERNLSRGRIPQGLQPRLRRIL